jgi:hypothetical protein
MEMQKCTSEVMLNFIFPYTLFRISHNGKNKEENAIIYKTLHSELQIETHEPHKKPRENIGSSEKSAVGMNSGERVTNVFFIQN